MSTETHDEREPDDTRGPAIAVTGGIHGGFKFYGPFETIDAAIEWYKQTPGGILGANVTIALLEKPKTKEQ